MKCVVFDLIHRVSYRTCWRKVKGASDQSETRVTYK